MTNPELDILAKKLMACARCGRRLCPCDLVVKLILGETWVVAHRTTKLGLRYTWCFSPYEDVVVWTGAVGELSRIEHR